MNENINYLGVHMDWSLVFFASVIGIIIAIILRLKYDSRN